MLRFFADDFITIVDSLASMEAGYEEYPKDIGDIASLQRSLERIEVACNAIHLTVSCVRLRRLLKMLKSGMYASNVTIRGDFIKELRGLRGRIKDELSERYFLFVYPEKIQFLEDKQPFGPQVIEQFPNATFDIEEASKCLALSRATASVFHLMRVMEEGLKLLAKLLGIPYAPSWESYIRQISENISQKHRKKGIRWKKDEPFFKEVLGNLESIKIAWRNPTMHIVRRYDDEEAEQIFIAVRLFMQRLAGRLTTKSF
jgi:hypothetical protein